MFYYKQLLNTLTNSSFLSRAFSSIQGSSTHAQSDPSISSNDSSLSGPTTETISLDDSDDEDDSNDSMVESARDPNLYLNYNNQVFIYYQDLKCLKPKEWLNDSIIEYCYTELYQAALEADRKKAASIHISNSFFYTRLLEANKKNMNLYQAASAWLKDINLFDKKLWLIPVCESNHWYLIAVAHPAQCTSNAKSTKNCRIFLLDSFGNVPINRLNLVVKFLKAAAAAQDLGFKKPIIAKLAVPQQKNSYDCGLYVLFFIKTIIEKKNRILQNESNTLKATTWKRSNFPTRKNILTSLKSKRLSY